MTTEELLDQITHTLADPDVGPDAVRTPAIEPPRPRGVLLDTEGRMTAIEIGDDVEAVGELVCRLTGSPVLGLVGLPGDLAMWFSVIREGEPNFTAIGLAGMLGRITPVPYGPVVFTGLPAAGPLGLPEETITALCAVSL